MMSGTEVTKADGGVTEAEGGYFRVVAGGTKVMEMELLRVSWPFLMDRC